MSGEFDDIRPFSEEEFPEVLKRLARNDYLITLLRTLRYPNLAPFLKKPVDFFTGRFIRHRLRNIRTIDQFQREIIVNQLIAWVIEKTTSGLTVSGLENLDKKKSYIFISNHRDIVLDVCFLNHFLVQAGFGITQIAIGDNLLINEFISDLMRANKSFIVKRNLPLREQIQASIQLSRYIHKTLEGGESIWIAQREGRAKDGQDLTNPAVIKMLYLAKRKSVLDFNAFVHACNIVPVVISYELDPCDTIKGWELHHVQTRGFHEKRKYEDLLSIAAGIKGKKGRVHLSFGEPLSGNYENDREVAADIDSWMKTHYRIWPSNYIAYDEIHGQETYRDKYSEEERRAFLNRFRRLVEPVRRVILKVYARAVENLEAEGGFS